jgi:3-oxoacyl-[acyl-carrier protein] reductase
MSEQTQRLNGKVVLVTGAGKGIGKAIALAYAREGAMVSCAARTLSDIQETVGEIEQLGAKGLAVQADVTKLDSVQHMVEVTVEFFGGLDILVVNAGGNLDRSSIDEGNPDDWVATLDVNLLGAYYTVKCAVEPLKRRGGGKVITIGSGMGHNGRPRSSAYSVAKAGLWMLTRVLAQELFEHNISVNELVPGPVVTKRAQQGHGERPESVFNIGSEWIKDPEDVAPLALFLATQPERGPTAQSFSLMRRDT